jgi:hypothetical protein
MPADGWLTAEQRAIVKARDWLDRRAFRRHRHPGCALDDAVATARLALVLASRTFDPARGVGFPAFASRRVLGALSDACDRERRLWRIDPRPAADGRCIPPIQWWPARLVGVAPPQAARCAGGRYRGDGPGRLTRAELTSSLRDPQPNENPRHVSLPAGIFGERDG